MVDERFTASAKGKYLLYHIYDNGKEIPPAEVIDLLNEQAERIELLEDDILAQTMTINNLEGVLKVAQKENEELRKELYIEQTDCKNIRESREYWRNKAEAMEDENEQLRKKCFELEKDYLIETSDEVDKALYLEDDLKKLANEYGVEDE